MANTPPEAPKASQHRRTDPISLRERLGPRDGTETAAWTGIFVLVLALVVAGVLIMFGGSGSGPAKPGTPGASGSTGGTVQSSSSGPLDHHGVWNPYVEVAGGGAAGTEASQALWTPVVQKFVTDFLGASHHRRWLSRVKPLVSPQLYTRLRRVDRTEIPNGTLGAITMGPSGDNAASVTAAYTANGHQLRLDVGVVDLPGDGRSWMVYSYADGS